MKNRASEIAILKNLIENELAKALNWSQEGWLWRLVQPLISKASQRFSEFGVEFDHYVGEHGIHKAAYAFLPKFTNRCLISGNELVPPIGPLLVVSNHPGAIDTLMIPASVARPDIKIVAGEIPFLQHLPRLGKHVIYAASSENIAARATVVRSGVRHLADGGALLIYPSGTIDPDPAIMRSAMNAIGTWSRSLEIFLRRVPNTQVLVTIVSGVIARKYMRHPLTWLRRQRKDRQRIAEMLQTIQQLLRDKMPPINPAITIGEPFSFTNGGSYNVMQNIKDYARQLLGKHWQLIAQA